MAHVDELAGFTLEQPHSLTRIKELAAHAGKLISVTLYTQDHTKGKPHFAAAFSTRALRAEPMPFGLIVSGQSETANVLPKSWLQKIVVQLPIIGRPVEQMIREEATGLHSTIIIERDDQPPIVVSPGINDQYRYVEVGDGSYKESWVPTLTYVSLAEDTQ